MPIITHHELFDFHWLTFRGLKLLKLSLPATLLTRRNMLRKRNSWNLKCGLPKLHRLRAWLDKSQNPCIAGGCRKWHCNYWQSRTSACKSVSKDLNKWNWFSRRIYIMYIHILYICEERTNNYQSSYLFDLVCRYVRKDWRFWLIVPMPSNDFIPTAHNMTMPRYCQCNNSWQVWWDIHHKAILLAWYLANPPNKGKQKQLSTWKTRLWWGWLLVVLAKNQILKVVFAISIS